MEISRGNHKIGRDTIIFNMNSATDCPSKKLDLCQLPDCGKCYAMKSEKQYPTVLPYRRRQEAFWTKHTSSKVGKEIALKIRRMRHNIKYIRFSESGDFKSQLSVFKMYLVAKSNPDQILYGYTARRDLNYSANIQKPKNLIINGSGFMVDNMFTVDVRYENSKYKCEGNCRVCDLCKTGGNKIIYQKFTNHKEGSLS